MPPSPHPPPPPPPNIKVAPRSLSLSVSKADFPLGEFFRANRIFSSTGMRSLIPTGATVFAGFFLFEKVSSNSFYFSGFPLGEFFRAKRFFSRRKDRASAFVFSTTPAIISINLCLIDCLAQNSTGKWRLLLILDICSC